MTAPYEESLARAHGTYNTVPNTISAGISVTGTSAHTANALLSYAGQWVYLLAVGGDITVMRGNQTVALGAGVNLPQGVLVPFYVSESGTYGLSCIASASGRTLYILSDSEAGYAYPLQADDRSAGRHDHRERPNERGGQGPCQSAQLRRGEPRKRSHSDGWRCLHGHHQRQALPESLRHRQHRLARGEPERGGDVDADRHDRLESGLDHSRCRLYARVNDIVLGGVPVTVDPTAASSIKYALSLPVTSNFAGGNDAVGVVYNAGSVGRVASDLTNDLLDVFCANTGTVATTNMVLFAYRVI